MEVLNIEHITVERLHELEDALRLETTPEEIKSDKYGMKLYKWLRRRRRKMIKILKLLETWW